MIELEVVGVTARPLSDEERQRRREQAEAALAEKSPPEPGAVAVPVVPTFETEVRLKERAGDRVLDISIGVPEAQAIALGLHGKLQPRPMTHDLIGNLLRALEDVSVLRVVITRRERETFDELQRRGDVVISSHGPPWTFHARLELRHRGRVLKVDCRPSDGIALAVRLGVPVLAADNLDPILAAA